VYYLKKVKNLLFFFLTISIFYFLIEIMTNLLVLNGIVRTPKINKIQTFTGFNKPCAKYDSIRGYRWYGKNNRIVYFVNGDTIIDQTFTPNNEGFICNIDYKKKKPSHIKKRYIVLGDSYTDAEFLEETWVDRLNKELPDSIEFYSFARSGGGLKNWHKVYFEEILPNYEFDGIIIAVAEDDLYRDYIFQHHDEKKAPTGFAPKLLSHFDVEKFSSYTFFYHEMLSDNIIYSRLNMEEREVGFHFWRKMKEKANVVIYKCNINQDIIKDSLKKDELNNPEKAFISFYGEQRLDIFSQIIQSCKKNKKDVILTGIADYYFTSQYRKTGISRQQFTLRFLAQKFDIDYFDSTFIFDKLNDRELRDSFFEYDEHWNQKGSNLFAEKFYKYYTKTH